MNRDEFQQLVDLARRLDCSPRRILVEAARMADIDPLRAREKLRAIRRQGMRQGVQFDECANLLLAPVSSFARDDLGSALDALWQFPGQAKE